MSGIRVVRAVGTPYDRGRTIGAVLGPTIRRSAEFNLGWFARRGIERSDIERLAGPMLAATERHLSGELAALRGMAEGAGLPLLDVLVPNAYEEIDGWLVARERDAASHRPGIDRCTAVLSAGPGRSVLGHDEQWLADEPGEIVVIVEVPSEPGVPAVVSPTVASWRPAVGWNSAGHAQGVMSLSADDDGPGIPRVLVSRDTLRSRDREEAIRLATPPERSGGYAYLHAFEGGPPLVVETSASGCAVVEGPMAHTNHYLDMGLAAVGGKPSPGSLARFERAVELVRAIAEPSPEAVQAIVSDHRSTPATICLHPDPADGDDAEAVLFSMVCDLEARRMWVAPGRPCETPFEDFDLDELVAG